MPITIYGTDWCDDTRRTRAFLAAKGIRPRFVDIDARPDEVHKLSQDGRPISIPVVIFANGVRLDDPSEAELAAAFAQNGLTVAVRHRTKLNQELDRFEQYRNDELVASAAFIERDGIVVIVQLDHHGPRDASLGDENVERLTSGLVEIANRSKRKVDIDLGAAPAKTDPTHDAEDHYLEGSTAEALRPVPTGEGCAVTQRFSELWSSGLAHQEAAAITTAEGLGRLAIIKGLHTMWEMPLTPEAMALAFGEPGVPDLAAMFHVLGWIIENNPTSTMSELQAFDDATGISVKTQALSMAKRPRDTIAVVDRMSPGLHLRTIDETRAREMAALTIRESEGGLRIQDQSTLRLSFGWVFLYQSTEYLETGDYSSMISGNAPLLVDRFTGALWITGTADRPDVYTQNYMATGDPIAAASSAS